MKCWGLQRGKMRIGQRPWCKFRETILGCTSLEGRDQSNGNLGHFVFITYLDLQISLLP